MYKRLSVKMRWAWLLNTVYYQLAVFGDSITDCIGSRNTLSYLWRLDRSDVILIHPLTPGHPAIQSHLLTQFPLRSSVEISSLTNNLILIIILNENSEHRYYDVLCLFPMHRLFSKMPAIWCMIMVILTVGWYWFHATWELRYWYL